MSIRLARKARALQPSPTIQIFSKAKKMIAQGIDVINFGVGEPDFNTPAFIKEAGKRAIDENFTRYTMVSGISELREAIVKKLQNDNDLEYSADQILVSPGAKASIAFVLMAICDPRDEVLIPVPYWVSYPFQVDIADARPVYISSDESTDFKITADRMEQAIDQCANPKAMILNSPNNPTGSLYKKEDLEKIAEICLKHNILVIADEIYEKLVYDGEKHYSIAQVSKEMKEMTVVVNGVSKAYAMTGWRLGYAAGPEKIIKAAAKLQGHITSGVNSIAQKAAVSAITENDGSIEKMRNEFSKRRNFLVDELNKIKNITCQLPKGAFYTMPNISFYLHNNNRGIKNSVELCEYILNEFHVAVVPGSAFGSDDNLRFSYANNMDSLREGLQRFAKALDNLN